MTKIMLYMFFHLKNVFLKDSSFPLLLHMFEVHMKYVAFEQEILSSYMWNYLHSKFEKILESLMKLAWGQLEFAFLHVWQFAQLKKKNWKGTSHIQCFTSITEIYY